MKDYISKNIIPGIVFLIFGVVMFFLTPGQIQTDETTAFTARTFPYLILGIVILCSVVLIVQGVFGLLKGQKDDLLKTAAGEHGNTLLLLKVLVLMIAAVLLGRLTGLLGSGILMGIGFMVLYRDRKPLHYAIVISIVAVSYFLFKSVFGLNLP